MQALGDISDPDIPLLLGELALPYQVARACTWASAAEAQEHVPVWFLEACIMRKSGSGTLLVAG